MTLHATVNSNNQARCTQSQSQQIMRGGAIIDAQGREIAITENMIQRACHELAKHYVAVQRTA